MNREDNANLASDHKLAMQQIADWKTPRNASKKTMSRDHGSASSRRARAITFQSFVAKRFDALRG